MNISEPRILNAFIILTKVILGICWAILETVTWELLSKLVELTRNDPATFYLLLQLFLNGEILQSVPNTPYLGITLSTNLKCNIHFYKYKCCQIIPMPSLCPSQPKISSGETATSILHFS